MVSLKYLAALFALPVLVACGVANEVTPITPTTCTAPAVLQNGVCVTSAATLLSAQLKDASTGTVLSSVAATAATDIVALLVTTDGKQAVGMDVSVDAGASTLLNFPNGTSAITDANGVARIRIGRANLYEFGSVTLALTSKSSATAKTSLAVRVDPPLLQLELRDTANTLTTTIGSSGLTTLKASLKFADGTPVASKKVDITGDLTKISFPEGSSQLTDAATGIATLKVIRASATVGGAGTLSGAATISGSNTLGTPITTVVTGALDYSVGAVTGGATLALDSLNVGSATSLAAYGTRQISVRAMLGSSIAPSVQVSFSSSCGRISPATAPTNSLGIATASFTATDGAGTTVSTLGCGGRTVDISVSAVGASSVSQSITVSAAPATNLSFVVPPDASKSRIYLANSGGPTQTFVQFLLSNARDEPLPGQDVLVSLRTLNGGTPPKATFDTVGNTKPVTLTTDSFGKISVPVFSGTVPTNVVLNAALASNSLVQTDSSWVVIASGRPVQSRVSLSVAKHAIRGFTFDGETTTLTMSLADRQGNPVPDGTAVNFVSEAGVMIPPTCVTGGVPGDSRCSVTIRTQNPRYLARKGYVSILAYAAGEEDFVDENANNVFDCGEKFTDLGTAYRDDTATSISFNAFVTGDFSVPRSASASLCGTGVTPSPTQGDGVWGAADVRGHAVIVFSTDEFEVKSPGWTSAKDPQWLNAIVTTGLNVSIQDMNGRSVPTGSTIAVAVTDASPNLPTDTLPSPTPPQPGDPVITPTYGTCSLSQQSHTAVPDSLEPLILTLSLKQCVTGDQISITVTTPAMPKTYTFSVP